MRQNVHHACRLPLVLSEPSILRCSFSPHFSSFKAPSHAAPRCLTLSQPFARRARHQRPESTMSVARTEQPPPFRSMRMSRLLRESERHASAASECCYSSDAENISFPPYSLPRPFTQQQCIRDRHSGRARRRCAPAFLSTLHRDTARAPVRRRQRT